jgi:hypothetical protein
LIPGEPRVSTGGQAAARYDCAPGTKMRAHTADTASRTRRLEAYCLVSAALATASVFASGAIDVSIARWFYDAAVGYVRYAAEILGFATTAFGRLWRYENWCF